MPRYYFDYHVGEAITLDDEGVDWLAPTLPASWRSRRLANC